MARLLLGSWRCGASQVLAWKSTDADSEFTDLEFSPALAPEDLARFWPRVAEAIADTLCRHFGQGVFLRDRIGNGLVAALPNKPAVYFPCTYPDAS